MASFFRQIVKKRGQDQILAFPCLLDILARFLFIRHPIVCKHMDEAVFLIFDKIDFDLQPVLRHSISIPCFLFQVSRRTRQSFLDGSN